MLSYSDMKSRTVAVKDALTLENKHFLEGGLSLQIFLFSGTWDLFPLTSDLISNVPSNFGSFKFRS